MPLTSDSVYTVMQIKAVGSKGEGERKVLRLFHSLLQSDWRRWKKKEKTKACVGGLGTVGGGGGEGGGLYIREKD